jgi:uncharacterized protein YndB with AHSA1/START domain
MEHESAVADERTITITRVVKARRQLAWEACTRPEHLDRWWGPDGFTTRTLAHELRVGGQWKYTMTAADGTVFPNLITYTGVALHEQLVYDHGDWNDPQLFQGSLIFTDVEGGTLITLHTIFPSKQARDLVVEQHGAIEGGQQTLAHLDAYLTAGNVRQ